MSAAQTLFQQREAIQTSAFYQGEYNPEHITAFVKYFLRASQSIQPYVGLVIQDALSANEVEAINSQGYNHHHPSFTNASFIAPIDQAVIEWWQESDLDPAITPSRLSPMRVIQNTGCSSHFDQLLIGKSECPKFGPLTVIAGLKGITDYILEVCGLNVFDPEQRIGFNDKLTNFKPHQQKLATLCEGDVIIFSNTPPTHHRAEERETRKVAVYSTFFHSV